MRSVLVSRVSKPRITAAFAAVALVVPLAACSALGSGASSSDSGGAYVQSSSDGSAEGVMPGSAEAGDLASVSSEATNGRSIISTGSVTVEVDDPEAATDEVEQLAGALGGYVESREVRAGSSGSSSSASLVIRVPSEKFEQAFDDLGEVGRLVEQSSSASDVTAQHVDLQARVASLETSVARLQDLMAGAATTSELLEAESALSARQAELEGLQAQLTALEDQIGESTIWVSLTTENVVVPGGPTNFWEGLLAGLNSIAVAGAGLLVLLGVLAPWLVVAGVVAFIIIAIVRGRRKSRARRQEPQQVAPQQPAPESQPGTPAQQPEVTPGE